MNVTRTLREAGSAVWIGGHLFGMLALPAAGRVLPRRRDRHRAIAAAWRAWTPIAYAALAATIAGTLLDEDRNRRSSLFLTSALLALASTTAGAVLGELMDHDLRGSSHLVRNEAGVPVAKFAHRRFLQVGVVPVNLVHGLAATGLIVAGG